MSMDEHTKYSLKYSFIHIFCRLPAFCRQKVIDTDNMGVLQAVFGDVAVSEGGRKTF